MVESQLMMLVEKLRQEQSFVSFYKQQIRQSVQELNDNCDQVFHSLWLSRTLSYGLHRVLTHTSHAQEWSQALSSSRDVKFLNASKVKSFHFVDRYSIFLTRLLDDPGLLAEILYHVEVEGLDCAWATSDAMGVVYGHCLFQRDHILFLQLMKELLKCHIQRCDSSKDLFSGVESMFNHVLADYCSQLLELRTFLTEVLCEPIMQVLSCEDYLEFDINKAANRYNQLVADHGGVVSSSMLLFSEDLDSSCQKLADLATLILQRLGRACRQVPVSIRWLLGTLRALVKEKWPNISPVELRRPISDAIFSSILSSPIVNPETFGVVDPSLIISEVGRYNLTQVTSVLQGCVWIMDKSTSTKYPIHKVVRLIDTELFFSVVDGMEWVSPGATIPEIPSLLPGLRRSAVLASQDQLDNLVGLVAMLLVSREGNGTFHKRLASLLSCLLPAMMEQATKNPYPILSRPFFSPPSTPAAGGAANSSSSMPPTPADYPDKSRSIRRRGKKGTVSGSLETLDVNSSSIATPTSHRSRNMASPQPMLEGGVAKGKSMKRSVSNDATLSMAATPTGFQLPSVVLVLPVQEKNVDTNTVQWDFDLLSEEEFMSQKLQSPNQKPLQGFSTLFHPPSSKVPTITATPASSTPATPPLSPPISAAPPVSPPAPAAPTTTSPILGASAPDSERVRSERSMTGGEGRESKKDVGSSRGKVGLRRQTSAGGRVKNMIEAIEEGTRFRSNTLPSSLSESESDYQVQVGIHSQSEGATPAESTAALLNGTEMTGEDFNHLEKEQEDSEGRGEARDGSKPPNQIDYTESCGIIPSKQTSGVLIPFTQQAMTISMSMEESASYVRVHPLPISLGMMTASEAEKGGELETRLIVIAKDQTDGEAATLNSSHSTPIKTHMSNGVRSGSSSPGIEDASDEAEKTPLHARCAGLQQGDSTKNLHQVDGSPGRVASDRKKKKKKWRLFKKRKSTDERKYEDGEEGEEDVDGEAKFRSQSDAPHQSLRVEFREQHQPRSQSHRLDGEVGVARKKRQDCYTLYMQDYSNKLEEQKKQSPRHSEAISTAGIEEEGSSIDLASTNDDLNRGDATPPAEMSPSDFKKSVYCSQLKFKLRSALQNVYTTFSSSHALTQVQNGGGVAKDVRYQLVMLLQDALEQRSWMQLDMETALISEILRMVEPLPNELIEVALEAVFEDYHRRSAYIAYLVHSHQKFQDTKMQVAAVQEAINRILHINVELFVNFSVCLYLEMPGQPRLSRLKSFSERMETLFLTDEKCSLMSRQLNFFSAAILEEDGTWRWWEDQERVAVCLSDYLFTRVYQHVFYPNGSTDKEVDMIFSDHLTMLAKTITIRHMSLQIPSVYHSGCPWTAAQRHLKDMAAYKSPRGKLHCIVQSLRILISLLQYARCGDPPGADDLFPVLVYVLIQANPPGMLSTCQYIRNFEESTLQGESAYWWAQFSTAVEFTKTLP